MQEIAEVEQDVPAAAEPERVGIAFGMEALKDLAAQQAKRASAGASEVSKAGKAAASAQKSSKYVKIDEGNEPR